MFARKKSPSSIETGHRRLFYAEEVKALFYCYFIFNFITFTATQTTTVNGDAVTHDSLLVKQGKGELLSKTFSPLSFNREKGLPLTCLIRI